MTHKNSDRLQDLTRWNRAGLTRFEYLDGDASVWLEELRIAMLGLYLRRKPADQRLPDVWRNAFMAEADDWPALKDETPAWTRLKSTVPALPETRGERSDRLLTQYDTRGDGDHAWEINRAFARALHVLLGHLDAYANEGYLRTATQWDNLRRLAAMVNYQPTPPASAITTVALHLYEGAGLAEIDRGLAMKHTPPEGGAPLIFETLEKLSAHPDLNAARVVNWNVNGTELDFGAGPETDKILWYADADQKLAVGDLVVLTETTNGSGEALTLTKSGPGSTEDQRELAFDRLPGKSNGTGWWSLSEYRLFTDPQDVRTGVARSQTGKAVVDFEAGAGMTVGDIIKVTANGDEHFVEVLAVNGSKITLDKGFGDISNVTAQAMAPYVAEADGWAKATQNAAEMYFIQSNGGVDTLPGENIDDEIGFGQVLGKKYNLKDSGASKGFVEVDDAPVLKGKVENPGIVVIPNTSAGSTKIVAFEGKPPKGIANGDWFVARHLDGGSPKALMVNGMKTSSGRYYIEFDEAPGSDHEETEFHGPMKTELRPVGYDHNPDPAAVAGQMVLTGITNDASTLLKPGRSVILTNPLKDAEQVKLTSAIVDPVKDTATITLDPLEAATGWAAGDTTVHLNCAMISHGETKGSQTLGSGDGERSAQSFPFTPKNISHIPSTATESGVIPDIDVLVEGETWDYRDLIDPTAEGTRAWSSMLNEDGTLTIRFRRRLPTGQNNVTVRRHRVGTGLKGSGVPALSFDKPMNKHRHVEKVLQPFETSGGADRESVSKLRSSTPQRLAANGRAVSLKDFEGLAERQSSVLRAFAEHLPNASATQEIRLTLALEGGAPLTDALEETLRPAILAKTIPGVRLTFEPYQPLLLDIEATVRADLTAHDKTDIKLACEEALQLHFELNARDFGEAAYRSEVLATLETVAGVETAQVTSFKLAETTASAESISTQNGVTAAVFPAAQQIAHVGPAISGAIQVEVEDIR